MSSFIKIKDASRVLGVSIQTLRNWDSQGKLKAHRHPFNNYRVYKTDDLYSILDMIETNVSIRKQKRDEVKKLEVKHLESGEVEVLEDLS